MDKDPPETKNLSPEQAGQGVLVRAANGDVIRYDQSGLIMRLSDKVIADIADRLDQMKIGGQLEVTAPLREVSDAPEDALQDHDVWDVQRRKDWLVFSARLPGRQGVRRFQRHIDGGAIIADAPGPLYGILGIGGARAAHAFEGPASFPQHVLAPADDIGSVGYAGIERAIETEKLEHTRDLTHEALVADTFLSWQMDKYGPLPLFVARVETDTSASAEQLSQGAACENLLIAARNLSKAAGALNKKPKILAISLSFSLEDVISSATEYRDGMLALMRRVEDGLAELGIDHPVFVTRFESGTSQITEAPVIDAQWELSWNSGDHRLVFSAPSYMFAHDNYDRPTRDALQEMAEMSAAALTDPLDWRCPVFHLAEFSRASEKPTIRAVAQSTADLTLDVSDPMGAGPTCGFSIFGATNDVQITSVDIDQRDAKTLLITLDKAPIGEDLKLAYAYGALPRESVYAANCGSVRDTWSMTSQTGRLLHRWALPCLLPVREGGGVDV
ncbi:MAG: hypothetical protein AAF755_07385 [Pseudomonadota bacterium]